MPRGIPKDPNHPRNKKRQDGGPPTSVAEPKRRGRPPGKKNIAKAAAPAPVATHQLKSAEPLFGKMSATHRQPGDVAAVNLVRENIDTIARAMNLVSPNHSAGELASALATQVKELTRLTNEALHPDDGDEEDEEVGTAVAAAPAIPPAPMLQTVPQQTNNSLPTPPSFVPPPFPPQ